MLEGLGEPLTYDKYASRLAKPLCLKIARFYDFLGAHEAIWLVNFALPSKGFASFTPSKLRLAFHHEAQNFLNHMAFYSVVGKMGMRL